MSANKVNRFTADKAVLVQIGMTKTIGIVKAVPHHIVLDYIVPRLGI